MNQPEKPIELNIDVEQWRRDIKTFAATTHLALEAIVSELSNRCTGDFADVDATKPHTSLEPNRQSLAAATRMPDRIENDYSTERDERLAQLNSRLAQRLAKSQQESAS